MNNTKLMFVLHAYQPPFPIQEKFVVERIIENCYLPFAEKLDRIDNIKVVLNINASLTEMLVEEAPDIISLLGSSMDDGKIEFLDSGAYHPIFPLIEDKYIKSQLKIN